MYFIDKLIKLEKVITIFNLYEIFRKTIIFFLILFLVCDYVRTDGKSKAISCEKTSNRTESTDNQIINRTELTDNQIINECFNEFTDLRYINPNHNYQHLLYEKSFNSLHITILTQAFQYMFAYFYWILKSRFKAKDFQFNNKSNNVNQQSISNDRENNLLVLDQNIDIPEEDRSEEDLVLIRKFKIALIRKGKCLDLTTYLIYYLFAGLEIYLSIGLPFVAHRENLLIIGFAAFLSLFKEDKLFPDQIDCNIIKNEYVNELYIDTIINEYDTVECKLNLNYFYFFIYLIISIYLLFLTIVTLISIIQFIVLCFHDNLRSNRLSFILPSIDKNIIDKLANDLHTYLVLESVNTALDKKRFERLIKLLNDDNFRIDYSLKEISTV